MIHYSEKIKIISAKEKDTQGRIQERHEFLVFFFQWSYKDST